MFAYLYGNCGNFCSIALVHDIDTIRFSIAHIMNNCKRLQDSKLYKKWGYTIGKVSTITLRPITFSHQRITLRHYLKPDELDDINRGTVAISKPMVYVAVMNY